MGQSRGMLKLFDDIRKDASVTANVLILGESGVGDESTETSTATASVFEKLLVFAQF